jgi:protoporphyrinogen oxidase
VSEPSSRPHTVILGAGPCGLYAARVLSRAGHRVTVIEKQDRPGGLATSHSRGGNWYDLGCHMLHEFDHEIWKDIEQLMAEETIPVELNAKIRWAGAFYRYPLKGGDMLKGIPFGKLCYYVAGLFAAQLRNTISPWTPKNAEEALIMLYGQPLYKFFFKGFTERYWGMHPSLLSATFITTKMPRLSAVDMLKKYLAKFGIKDRSGVHAVDSALREETLHYSRTGAEAMPRHLAKAIQDAGSTIILNADLCGIQMEDNRVKAVRYEQNGQEHTLYCDECIATIPLPRLIHAAQQHVPQEVTQATSAIRYKPIAIYGLLVKKPKCIDALYIYYRDRVFHRVGEPKNAGLTVTPADHSVLIVETTCELGDEKWLGSDAIKKQIFADLAVEGICTQEEVVECHILRSETGYPIFSLGFEPHLKVIQDWIASIPNLQSTGRQGAFTYPNMHSAMRMGAKAAQAVMAKQAGS